MFVLLETPNIMSIMSLLSYADFFYISNLAVVISVVTSSDAVDLILIVGIIFFF